jgi:mycolipenoyl-CoA---2-(long-chain-fatty acyl)-trehalose mycolipenoyltransferase / long-chain-acyl-CoA---trehalose acyltransferase
LFIGPVAIGAIDEWEPEAGSAVSWQPSSSARAKALQAPVSDVPISHMQAQHFRNYCEQVDRGLDYSRLLIVTCDIPGQCDIRAMNYVINTHLRRHDTYRSWFEYTDDKRIVRHTMTNPADIEFTPTEHGEMTVQELRDLLVAAPDPRQWDCFRFGVVQSADRFTMYVSIDHLHMDAMFVVVALMEFHMMYSTLVAGNPPIPLADAGSYDDFCIRQHEYLSTLTLDNPQVRAWTEFAENNNGSFPDFPLPLGDPLVPCGADLYTITLMNEEQTARFEAACVQADARFIGGVMACAALADHEFTGADTYYGLTPTDARSSPADFMTAGWFTGLIPITIPIEASFGDCARAAQACFDAGEATAKVPFYRVLELAPSLTWPRHNFPVVNFFDAGAPPFSLLVTADLGAMNIGIYSDGRYSYQMSIFVVRLENETAVSILAPENPIARESVARWAAAMKSACVRVADGRDDVPLRRVANA